MSNLLTWSLVAAGVLMGALGALFLKLGATALNKSQLEGIQLIAAAALTPQILVGLGLYVAPTLLWIWLLRRMELTVLQPALSLTYVATALLAFFVLNEPVGAQRWLGILLIVAGVVLVARS